MKEMRKKLFQLLKAHLYATIFSPTGFSPSPLPKAFWEMLEIVQSEKSPSRGEKCQGATTETL